MDSDLPPSNNPPPLPPAPPVYNRPPPVIAPMPGPRPAKKGSGWKVFAIILVVLLVFSLWGNIKHAVSSVTGGKIRSGRGYGPRLEEVTVRDNNSANKIAVVPIEGIISGEATDGSGFSLVTMVREQLKLARKDADVKAVILKVNSPGGEVLASDEIAKAIRDFQDKSQKPVVVSMGSLAASGGYLVSVPCRWIVANELTITGSIGVIMEGLNYRGLLDKIGVRPEVFKSGKFKDMLSGMKEPEETTAEEKQMVQALIDETFAKFKSVVQNGRESAFKLNESAHAEAEMSHGLSQDWTNYADGRILSGTDARRLGFVDELGDFDVAVKRTQKLAGIGTADLIQYQPIFNLANLLGLFGKSDAKSVKVDLGMDVPKLHAGYLYFLSPNYIQ